MKKGLRLVTNVVLLACAQENDTHQEAAPHTSLDHMYDGNFRGIKGFRAGSSGHVRNPIVKPTGVLVNLICPPESRLSPF